MTYWNLVLHRGVERFAADLAAHGGAGLITPDLIPEEADEWIAASDEHGLDRVFLVGAVVHPRAAHQGHRARAAASSTRRPRWASPAPAPSVDGDARGLVERTRAVTDLPVCVGLGRVDRGAGRRAGRLRRRRHRRLRAGAHAQRPRGTRRPARGVARTDDRAGRRSEDEAMSTEMDGATPVVADDEPSTGRERLLDVVGLLPRLFLGVVLIYAGVDQDRPPADRPARGAGLRAASPTASPTPSGWPCPSSRSSWACCSCSACSPGRPPSPRRCSWWSSSSASRRPGPVG